ncbi:MAG: hypothetical protein AB7O67_01020 [Vicinamibacterales bacterium]
MWLALITVVGSADPLVAQPAPATATTEATVLDADGRQVATLGAADFQVTVDGQARRVVAADYIRLDAARDGGSPYYSTNRSSAPAGRFVLLLVDQRQIAPEAAPAAMQALARLVNALSAHDRIALAAIPAPGEFVDFTTDHGQVRQALLRIRGEPLLPGRRTGLSLAEALAIHERSDMRLATRALDRECGSGLDADTRLRCQGDVARQAGELAGAARDRSRQTLAAIDDVLRRLEPIVGPKTVLLVSAGLLADHQRASIDAVAATAASVRASIDVLLVTDPPVGRGGAREGPGLTVLANAARGGVHRLDANGLDRIREAVAGYYVLGLEAVPTDDTPGGGRALVRTTAAPGTIVRARARVTAVEAAPATAEEAVARALRAALPTTALPMRLATWTFKAPGTQDMRLLLAAEVERPADQPLTYTTGVVVVDETGHLVANAVRPAALSPHPHDPTIGTYSASVTVPPGRYRVRLAVVDPAGRVGSVERFVDAAAVDPGAAAAGDMVIAAAPGGMQGSLAPGVEARVGEEPLAALAELYLPAGGTPAGVEATLDVVQAADGAPLLSSAMQIGTGPSPEIATAQTMVETTSLAPGRYLARITFHAAGRTLGAMLRPFLVLPAAAASRPGRTAGASTLSAPPGLRRGLLDAVPTAAVDRLLEADALDRILAVVAEGQSTTVAHAVATARVEGFGGAAFAVLDEGQQGLATFLRALDFVERADTAKAEQTLRTAVQLLPSLAPARLFLGAVLAGTGRYRDAAGLLQSVPATLAPAAPLLAGEAWLKAGEAALAIEPLEHAAAGDDPRAARSLAFAYLLADRATEALPVLAAYLGDHGDDGPALAAAVFAAYSRHTPAPVTATLGPDRERAAAWARACQRTGGPFSALVESWVIHLNGLQ